MQTAVETVENARATVRDTLKLLQTQLAALATAKTIAAYVSGEDSSYRERRPARTDAIVRLDQVGLDTALSRIAIEAAPEAPRPVWTYRASDGSLQEVRPGTGAMRAG
ncbi:hypothetical protein [Conexibacter sp. CPCC 206217]|uniref:hypothetical protein n=1 Tax=Conexibacter sp. CPCC 206217 TaxID=3064574 RepID=UPI0027186483|nr:hypothetical protein [Conexibacter sp. CPCC 206217]MDO8208945.1 hypothetical protein [Conexibacter sp. CPCC 206217]